MSKTTKEQHDTYRSLFAESESPMAVFVKQMIDDLEAAEQEVQRLRSAISWALGEGDDFPLRTEEDGPFYWRRELRERARGKTQPPQVQESESE